MKNSKSSITALCVIMIDCLPFILLRKKKSACKRRWLYWEYLHWQRSSVPSYYSCIDLPHEEHSLHLHGVICHQCIPAVVSHKSGWLERILPPGTIMHMPLPTQHFGVWNIVSSWDRERQCYFLCVNMSHHSRPWSFPGLPRVCLTLKYNVPVPVTNDC